MKKILSAIVLLTFFVPSVVLSLSRSPEKTGQQTEKKLADFKATQNWNKLDGRFKKVYEDAIAKGDREILFECLMKTASKPTDEEKKNLISAGYNYRSVINTILTGSVKAKDVEAVASLPFVKIMELAVPVSTK